MTTKQITLRCEDGQEAAVFTKYNFCTPNKDIDKDIEFNYEIMIEDCYIGGDYRGFFGRIKRAWGAFVDKPVVYTGIYCEDKDKMRKFLTDCLALIDEEEV